MSQPATVEGLGPVYARLYGFINAHAPATEGDAEVAPESVQDIYITQFPFVIGDYAVQRLAVMRELPCAP